MAEFDHVMSSLKRMCDTACSEDYPILMAAVAEGYSNCSLFILRNHERIEKFVLDWVEKNKRVTYISYLQRVLPDISIQYTGNCVLHPLFGVRPCGKYKCGSSLECHACINREIPEPVAKRLGISIYEEGTSK